MRKQSMTHEQFVGLFEQARMTVSRREIDKLIDRTAEDIRAVARGRNAAFAWSGGKDSMALELVCRLASVDECVFGMTNLEYPAMLRWVTAHMPPRLEVINNGLDLDWLAANPDMLFPRNSAIAARWFGRVQHAAQRQFAKARKLDVLFVGRRRDDGNNCQTRTAEGGHITYCPLADWTHVDVFAAVHHHGLALAPFYTWPRGYRCGTHPWPARQWCTSTRHGWQEIDAIDPAIVRFAADRLPSAREYLEASR